MNETVREFLKRINQVTDRYLSGFDCGPGSEKVIHDPIWGSVVYTRWEVQLIDTPLFQRLRDLRQLGMAEYTYPAARHSRYEHSLGTVAIASRMLENLRARYGTKKSESDPATVITDRDIHTVRLAALLHDIGHCVFSHLSESVYGEMPEFKAVRKWVLEDCGQEISPKPHELMSYLIITSDSFLRFFYKNIAFPGKGSRTSCAKLLREAANMVIGVNNFVHIGERLVCRSFLTGIINSDFDADKLDYTQRDSYTAGIALTYGVDRFLMKLVIGRRETRDYTEFRLAVTENALITVEELIFNRNILYVYLYRHQKVLATEDVMRDCLYGLVRSGRIQHPCDFLLLSDSDIRTLASDPGVPFPEDAPDKSFADLLDEIGGRNLPKRCLILDGKDLDSDTEALDSAVSEALDEIREADPEAAAERLRRFGTSYARLLSRGSAITVIKKLVSGIATGVGEQYTQTRRDWLELIRKRYKAEGLDPSDLDILDLHIVIPRLSESRLSLNVADPSGDGFQREEFGYINNWSDAFGADKWRGYFFCSSRVDRRIAGQAARELIRDRMGWLFNMDIGQIPE